MPRIERTLALYALILALGGGLFVTIFWTIGAINLLSDTGLISEMIMGDWGRWLYFAYPFVLIASMLISIPLFVGRREAAAVGVAGLPIASVVLYYLVATALTGWVA